MNFRFMAGLSSEARAMTDAPVSADSIDTLIATRLPGWLTHYSPDRLRALRLALDRQDTATQALSEVLKAIPSLENFALPLVEGLLQNAGHGAHDPRRTWLRIEQQVQLPTAAPSLPAPRYTHVSRQTLLAAALHNFHVGETRPWLLRKAYLSDAAGKRLAMGFEAFAGRCRVLDVGGRYQALLGTHLRPADPVRKRHIESLFEETLDAHLEVAVRMAHAKGELEEQHYLRMLPIIAPRPIVAAVPGVTAPRQLYLLGKRVRGAVTLELRDSSRGPATGVIAYLPGDPVQAVFHEATWQALYDRLASRLKDAAYRQYFQRFIAERDRPAFFTALTSQLAEVDFKALQLDGRNLAVDLALLAHLRTVQIDKLFDDARVLATPTGDEDDDDRRQRLDAYKSLGLDLLNLASLFMPVVGQVMLAVTAVQIASEVYEGFEDWRIGDRKGALDHLFGVAENIAVGVVVGKATNLATRELKRLAFVDDLVPVGTAGQTRLATSATAGYVEPGGWEGEGTLLRRLNGRLEELTDDTSKQLLQITGFSQDQIRRLHLEGAGVPARVLDALECYQLHEQYPLERGEALTRRFEQRQTLPGEVEQLLIRDFPGLTLRATQEILSQASGEQVASLLSTQRVPLALAERARWYLRESRLDRACAGLRLDRATNEDTEKLVFGLLARMAPWPANERLELRQGNAQGALLMAVGAPEATRSVCMLRTSGGYRLEGGAADDGLIAVVHQALSADHARLLAEGGQAGVDGLRERLADAAAADRNSIAGLLAMAPIGAGVRPPRRFADGRLGYPLSGRGAGDRQALRRGIWRIYPTLSEEELESYLLAVQRHGEGLWEHFGHVQAQLERLRQALSRWQNNSQGLMDGLRRRRVVQQFRRSWRRKITNYAGEYVLEINGEHVGRLPRLPRGVNYSHVVRLRLSNMALTGLDDDFLGRFENLVELDLRGNKLVEVPVGVEQLRHLRELRLGGNNIVMDNAGEARLAALSRLQLLDLEYNTLARAPRLLNLRHLRSVRLNGTGLDALPDGVAWRAHVDLRDNSIRQLREDVDVLRQRVDRLALHDNPLDAASTQRLDQAAGIERSGARGSARHRHRNTDEAMRNLWLGEPEGEVRERRLQTWTRLRAEPGSSSLFVFLADFAYSEEFELHPGHYRARIWRILNACEHHESLRERLFLQAGGPRTCEDRLLLILEQLELGVLVEYAIDDVPPAQLERKLVELGRGLYRLDEVDRLAEQHIAGMRANNDPLLDEIEIKLFYRLKLAEALALPLTADSMHYEAFAHVSTRDLIKAQEKVLADETADAVIASLAQRPYWETHVRNRFAERFDSETQRFGAMLETHEQELAKGSIDEWLFNTRSIGLMHEYEAVERKLIHLLAKEAYERVNP
jgi:hypothetical protein